jgi:hypothetical protein
VPLYAKRARWRPPLIRAGATSVGDPAAILHNRLLGQGVALDLAAQRGAADGEEEVAIGDGEVQGGTPPEAGDEIGDQIAVERIQLQEFRAVDSLAGEHCQELSRVLVRVDGDTRRCLACLVKTGRVRRADVDPGAVCAGEVADRDGWFVRISVNSRQYASTRVARCSSVSDGCRAAFSDSVS